MKLVTLWLGMPFAEADPVQKVTIVGRGQAGGMTWFRPDEDRIADVAQKTHGNSGLCAWWPCC